VYRLIFVGCVHTLAPSVSLNDCLNVVCVLVQARYPFNFSFVSVSCLFKGRVAKFFFLSQTEEDPHRKSLYQEVSPGELKQTLIVALQPVEILGLEVRYKVNIDCGVQSCVRSSVPDRPVGNSCYVGEKKETM
jgi:hypothetical protein